MQKITKQKRIRTKAFKSSATTSYITDDELIRLAEIVANHFGHNHNILAIRTRKFEVIEIRHLFNALAYTHLLNYGLSKIAAISLNMHCSVIHSKKVVLRERSFQQKYYELVAILKIYGFEEKLKLGEPRKPKIKRINNFNNESD